MDLARIFDEKKFMWDGEEYETVAKAEEVAGSYREKGFEVEVFEEGEKYYVFSRRVVKEIVVEGQPV